MSKPARAWGIRRHLPKSVPVLLPYAWRTKEDALEECCIEDDDIFEGHDRPVRVVIVPLARYRELVRHWKGDANVFIDQDRDGRTGDV